MQSQASISPQGELPHKVSRSRPQYPTHSPSRKYVSLRIHTPPEMNRFIAHFNRPRVHVPEPTPSYLKYQEPNPRNMSPVINAVHYTILKNNISAGQTVVLPNVALHHPTLRMVNLGEDIQRTLSSSGFGLTEVLANKNYQCLTMEFLSSLRMNKDEHGNYESWSFKLNDEEVHLDRMEIGLILGFRNEGTIPIGHNNSREGMWRYLSEDDSIPPIMYAERIQNTLGRILHQFIAMNITPRADAGLTVTLEDLDILAALIRYESIDYFSIISREFEKMSDLSGNTFPNIIGGGAYITELARNVGFNFDEIKGSYYEMDADYLVCAGILKKHTYMWKFPLEPEIEKDWLEEMEEILAKEEKREWDMQFKDSDGDM